MSILQMTRHMILRKKNVITLQDLMNLELLLNAPYTPQQNGIVVRQFATDLRRASSMMEAAYLN
jgi:hypothetical protein